MRLHQLLYTRAPGVTVLIRLMVGSVFLSEGIQKFLFPLALGAGRFAKIGFAYPEVLAPMVGTFEIVCGALVLVGFVTRVAVVPLAVIILTALVTTKLPILVGAASGPGGFWAMLHEARTDWSMLLGSVFLGLVGAGPWSLDARLARASAHAPHPGDHYDDGAPARP